VTEPVATLRRTETRFKASGGRTLFCRSWTPPLATRVMVLVHGFGEHSGRYEEMARWFATRDFAVYAYDQTGHGQSSGARGHVESFRDYHDDLECFIALSREANPGLPVVLVGHSMGGLVVAGLVSERAPEIDLLVTSGALLALSPDLSPLKLLAARVLRRILPSLSMDAGLDPDGLSRDPDVIARYLQDPLVHGRATASMAAEMSDAIVRAGKGANDVDVPVLVLHGADDPLCLPAGSQHFFAGLPRSDVAGSEIHIYPSLRHEIFNEPERERVFSDVLTWVEARLEDLEKEEEGA
jgi:alpha-beta hydrolase superfamily lysophospholipase